MPAPPNDRLAAENLRVYGKAPQQFGFVHRAAPDSDRMHVSPSDVPVVTFANKSLGLLPFTASMRPELSRFVNSPCVNHWARVRPIRILPSSGLRSNPEMHADLRRSSPEVDPEFVHSRRIARNPK